MAYEIEGRLLEVCTCNVLCPCWVGEDPDYKTCDTTIAWGIEKGSIEGVDVERPDDGGLRPHPEEHPDPEVLEGRRLRRRAGDPRAGGRDAPAVHRAARRRGRRSRRAHRRGRRRRARADHLHRRGRQGQLIDRHARRGRDGAVRRRDRQPDDARGNRLQHDPGLAGLRQQGQPVHEGRERATGSRASTSRATTPSRATSASRPDGGERSGRCSRRRTCASPVATGRSSAGTLVALAVAGLARAVAVGGVALRALPPPRRRRRRRRWRSRPRSSRSAGC